MFERNPILPWRRRRSELMKERVQSLSLHRRADADLFRPSLSETASLLSRDWGYNLHRDKQGVLPLDPPAA